MTAYDPAQAMDQITSGLVQVAFDPIAGLNGFPHPTASPPLPAGIVFPPEIDYRQAMSRGVIGLAFELWVMVGTSAGFDQQQSLWPYMNWAGSSSIVALIDANPSLGILGADDQPRVQAHVSTARRLTFEEMAYLETSGFGVAFETTVVVTNKE